MYEKRKRERNQGQIHMISIDDLVPQDHILRKIDTAIDFDFIYDEVEGMYSDFNGGRPGIDPVSLFKIVMVQYLSAYAPCGRLSKKLKQIMRTAGLSVMI